MRSDKTQKSVFIEKEQTKTFIALVMLLVFILNKKYDLKNKDAVSMTRLNGRFKQYLKHIKYNLTQNRFGGSKYIRRIKSSLISGLFTSTIKRLWVIRQPYVLLFCILLFITYFSLFYPKVTYSDIVKIQGDSWYYQMRAVNLAYGDDFDQSTFFEKYAFSRTDIHKTTGYEHFIYEGANMSELHPWCPPVYPIFLAGVYKIFGVSPQIAKYIQLLLLLFVAAFLPLLGFYLWKGKGVVIGIVTGLFFIFKQYPQAGEIMTECLQIFLIFILLFGFYFYHKTKSLLASFFVGVLLAVNLLVKGIIIFIPIFYFFYLFRNDNYKLLTFLRSKWLMLVSFVFVVSLWTIHLNSVNGFVEEVKVDGEAQVIRELSKEISELANSSSGIKSSHEYFNQIYERVNQKTSGYNSSLHVLEENIVKNQFLTEEQKIDSLNVIIRSVVKPVLASTAKGIKIFGQRYILHPDRFMLISSNSDRTILEANCMRSVNGAVVVDNNIRGTYDEHYDWSPTHRVLNFYWNNPQVIPVIFPNKLYRGFSSFPFFILIFVLIFFDFVWQSGRRVWSRSVWWIVPLLLSFFILASEALNNKFYFIPCFLAGLFALALSYLLKIRLVLFQIPFYINMFLVNFILIALIHFGLDRFNSIVNFIVILTALYYLFGLMTEIYRMNFVPGYRKVT